MNIDPKVFDDLDPFTPADIWTRYAVVLEGVRPTVGGTPLNPDVAAAHLAVKAGDPDLLEQVIEDLHFEGTEEERKAAIEEAKADKILKITTGFRRDATGLFFRGYNINAMCREAASAAGLLTAVRGSRQALQHCFFVIGEGHDGDAVYIRGADGQPVKEPTSVEQSVVHAMTPQGKIAAIKRFECVFPWSVRFCIDVLDPRKYIKALNPKAAASEKIKQDFLQVVLTVGGKNGLGANRSAYYGEFKVAGWKCLDDVSGDEVGAALAARRKPQRNSKAVSTAE